MEFDGIGKNDVLERIRDFPKGEVAEDVLRELMPEGVDEVRESVRRALDSLYQIMDKHGPFDGICAYSEGATIAATLILDEKRRLAETRRPRQIEHAVFFAGWPPLMPNSNNIVLVDTSDFEGFIDIPTCHVVGAEDPYFQGAMALYNVCDEDIAYLSDHGKV